MARRRKDEVNGAAHSDAPTEEIPTTGDDTRGAEERPQPVHRIRIRNVAGAIWQNSRQDGSTYLTFNVSRTYRDDANNWHSSGSFGAPDGFLLAEVARQCALWIVSQTQGDPVPF